MTQKDIAKELRYIADEIEKGSLRANLIMNNNLLRFVLGPDYREIEGELCETKGTGDD